tara:strand:+ start:53529 stop:53891 length:363 start_codon:yes stop_codon:yes gene_type:complete
MSFKFERLHIWQKAMTLGEEINNAVNKFPKKEMYNLSSQIRRAADSIALNISEGCIVQSNREYRKFLGYSIRSLAEVVTCLYKAKYRSYISEADFDEKYSKCYLLMNMMIAFRNTIKPKN